MLFWADLFRFHTKQSELGHPSNFAALRILQLFPILLVTTPNTIPHVPATSTLQLSLSRASRTVPAPLKLDQIWFHCMDGRVDNHCVKDCQWV